ncbi:armadillo-type protein [Coprinopsis sp. MPI-PUGE-AT-0042]|nr:armadillo-type protein [Coprinopsis sp. MPI-PUGE-AT-0042]
MFALKPSAFTPPGFPPANLLYALTAQEPGVRSQANTILVAFAQQGHLESSKMEDLLLEYFDTIFDFSYTPNTIQECLEAAASICETTYKEVAIKAFSERMHKALESNDLSKNQEFQRALVVVEKIVRLVTEPARTFQGVQFEDVLWILAPRLIEVDLTLRFPPFFERWYWLTTLFSFAIGERASKYRNRLQGPLRLGLTKVFRFDFGGPEEGGTDVSNLMLDQHELLEPLANLLSVNAFIGPHLHAALVPDFETLEQALVPSIPNIVAVALRAQDLMILSGISVLLALSERWHRSFLWYPRDESNVTLPSTQVRDEVYRTLQTFLLSHEAPVTFTRYLLHEMKRVKRGGAIDSPDKKSDQEAAGTTNTAGAQGLEPTVGELLQCFIKRRWHDAEAVQLLMHLMADESDGYYYDAVVACLPKEVKDIWNESMSGNGGAVPLVASLVESLVARGWSDGIDLLLDLALHNPSVDTRNAAIRSLLSLSNNQDSWEVIKDVIQSKIRMLVAKPRMVDEAKQDIIVVNCKVLLVGISSSAASRDFCSFILSHMDSENPADQILNLPTDAPQVALSDYTKRIEDLGLHSNVHIRQAALECLARAAPESDATGFLKKLLGLALGDSDEPLKRFCLTRLVDIAANVQLLLSLIAAVEDVNRKDLDSITDISWRKQWVNLLRELSWHGTYVHGLVALVRIAETDERWEVRVAAIESLSKLADDHSETIVTRTILARNAKVGSKDPAPQARKAWASTLGSLSRMGHWKDGPEALINMALRDNEEEVRYQAYREIDMLLRAGAGCAASTLTSLTHAFERMILGNEIDAHWLFTDVGSTRNPGVSSPLTLGNDLASAFWNPLIKQGVVDSVSSYRLDFTMTFVATHATSDHYNVILKCVLENLATSSPVGANQAMEMVSLMWRRSDPSWRIDSFVAYLPPLLQHGSKHVRAAALNISSRFFSSKYTYDGSTGILIPHLVSMVLDDRNDSLRNDAAELLCAMCTSRYWYAARELASPLNLDRLLELLSAPRPLNATTARLVGILYQHDEARERIGFWIIDKVVMTQDITSNLEQGVLTLLSELISQCALNSNSTLDYLLLFLSSSLALKGTPTTESYRPLILTSLSLHYPNQIPYQRSESTAEFVCAFEYAAFGRHGTEAEAKAWLAMRQHLQEQPQSSQDQGAESKRTFSKHSLTQAFEDTTFGRHGTEGGLEVRAVVPVNHSASSLEEHPKLRQSQAVEDEEKVDYRKDVV